MKRGFAVGDNAAAAARRNHELGTAHRWSSKEAAEAGKRSAEVRWGDRSSDSSALTAPASTVTSNVAREP